MGERNVFGLHTLLIGIVLLAAIVGAVGTVNPNLAPQLYGSYLRGDANSDGLLDIADAILVLQHSNGYLVNGQPVSINLANADYDRNKRVNVQDATAMLTALFSTPQTTQQTKTGVQLGPGIIPLACPGTFSRYDLDNSGGINIADPVAHLSILFPGGTTPPSLPCIDKADANGDNVHNIADVVWALSYMFAGGLPIAPTYNPDYSSIAEIRPGVDEQCDTVDNDVDGTVDEGCTIVAVWTVFPTRFIDFANPGFLQLPFGNTPQEALDNADQLCNDQAILQGAPSGDYVAWLSNSMLDARDRIVDGEYVNLFGDTIANNKNDLLDGTLDQIIWSNPYTCTPGFGCNEEDYVTGTASNGTGTDYHCGDWILDISYSNLAMRGYSAAMTESWTAYPFNLPACAGDPNNFFSLLCFQVA